MGDGRRLVVEVRRPREVVENLGVSEVSVRRWVAEGRLEAIKLGDSPQAPIRIEQAAVERFVRTAGPERP